MDTLFEWSSNNTSINRIRFLIINVFLCVFAMVQQAYWDLPQRCSFLDNFGGKHLIYLRGEIFFKIYYVPYLLRSSMLIVRSHLYRDNFSPG